MTYKIKPVFLLKGKPANPDNITYTKLLLQLEQIRYYHWQNCRLRLLFLNGYFISLRWHNRQCLNRAKSIPLPCMSKLIHPHINFQNWKLNSLRCSAAKTNGGGVGYRPRVHVHLFRIVFITIELQTCAWWTVFNIIVKKNLTSFRKIFWYLLFKNNKICFSKKIVAML